MNLLKEELLRISHEIIAEIVNNITIYYRPSNKITNLTDTSFQIEGYNKPDYFSTMHANVNKILFEYDFSSTDNILRNHYPFLLNEAKLRFGIGRFGRERIIEVVLVNIISKGINKENYSNKIIQVINEFIDSIQRKKIHLDVYIPIRNLSLEGGIDQIVFGNGFSVKRLLEDEIESLFLDRTYDMDLGDICRYSILYSSDEDIIFNNTTFDVRSGDKFLENEINKIIYSLNITSKGSLGFEAKYFIYDDIFKYFFGNKSTRSLKRVIGSAPKLNEESVEKWKYYYNYLSGIDYTPFLLAFKKLQEAETRLEPEDSIIDAVIGLESLLLNILGTKQLEVK